MLTDIAIAHIYKGRKADRRFEFTMHPAPNQVGLHAGKFEIVFTREDGSTKRKRSSHVTQTELAELYARGLIEQHRLRLRLAPGNGEIYPVPHPGKYVSPAHIARGSNFDRIVRSAPNSGQLPENLRAVLQELGVLK